LLGACSECPSVKFIIVDLVEQTLKKEISEIKRVVLINEVDQELSYTVKKIFKKTDKESCG
jgi:Fe-S cluster biogenesis protein NfuA